MSWAETQSGVTVWTVTRGPAEGGMTGLLRIAHTATSAVSGRRMRAARPRLS